MDDFIKSFLFLFAVIDPIGSVPVFIEATKNFSKLEKQKIALRASLIAFLILLFFTTAGHMIMDIMQISMDAFQISGGIILFLFALSMIFGEGKPEEEKHLIKDYTHVTIFPIAMPSLASPASIMTVVIVTDAQTHPLTDQIFTMLTAALVLGIAYLLFLSSHFIQSRVSESILTVLSKIMGLIIASFAVQSVISGIRDYFFSP
jgi:multiple antibiotic resistance protein